MYISHLQIVLTDGWLENTPAIITEGLIGTALMTLFMYGLTYLTRRTMKVVRILGTMLTFSTGPSGRLSDRPLASVVGAIAHFGVGVLFSYCFHLLWTMGVGQPDSIHILLFGFGFGLVGITVWYLFYRFHPNPPKLYLRSYLFCLLLAHIVYAAGVILTHHWIHIVILPVQPY